MSRLMERVVRMDALFMFLFIHIILFFIGFRDN